jgi:hypothetical protein
MPTGKHTTKYLKILPSARNSSRDEGRSRKNLKNQPLIVGSAAPIKAKVLEFRPTGPHGEDPDEGYHIKVGDKIILEIRLTVESVNSHPDRTFVLGRADEDGSMVAFDEEAAHAIFWNMDDRSGPPSSSR